MKTRFLILIVLFTTMDIARCNTKWLDELNLNLMEIEFGKNFKNINFSGNPLCVSGKKFERGVATMPVSKFLINLDGSGEQFVADVGLDDSNRGESEAEFIILGDKKILWRSGILKKGDQAVHVSISIKGMKRLALLVIRGSKKVDIGPGMMGPDAAGAPPMPPAGDFPDGTPGGTPPSGMGMPPFMALADWGDAKIEYTGDFAPEAIQNVAEVSSKPTILTPSAPIFPRFNGPKVVGATPAKPFIFTIPVSGEKPISFSVGNLPKSLSVDLTSGIIQGTAPEKGTYAVKIHVKNKHGEASEVIKIVVGELLALTPPMGWNSWNAWGVKVDDDKVRAATDAMVAKLRDYGWSYINIDDGWQAASRNNKKELMPNEKFPDIKRLADYVHSKGLKIGLYSSPGPKTCGGFLGSFQNEQLDAQTWADWGIDYLKYDWCSYRNTAPGGSVEGMKKPYQVMRDALKSTNRDVVYSLCQYGMGNVATWGAEVNGNLWRTSMDIQDSWKSLRQTGFSVISNAEFVNPGHWNDPDMLVIGEVGGWSGNIKSTRLTPDEQYTHVSLWSLLAAPLLIGCNLTTIDDFTLSLLTNSEVIAVNQDPLGKQAKQIIKGEDYEIWAKDMEDGSKAMGIFYVGNESENPVDMFHWGDNTNNQPKTITLKWSDLGFNGTYNVRDLWRQKDLGSFKEKFETKVNLHGVLLIKITQL
jgi:alpha-galactosidase